MGMTQEEKIAVADMVRSHDRFGPVSLEELTALPGKEQELWIRRKMESVCMFLKNVRGICQSRRIHCVHLHLLKTRRWRPFRTA